MMALFKVSQEILGIIMIPLAMTWMGLRFHPGLYLPLTVIVIFLRLFRFGDILVPMYFFRPFNLFLDAQFVPDLLHLLYTTVSLKTFIFAVILTVMLLVGISWGVWRSLKTIHNFFAYHRHRRIVLLLIVAILLTLPNMTAGGIHLPGRSLAKPFFHRVVEEFDFILNVKAHHVRQLGIIENTVEAGSQIPSSLDKLNGLEFRLSGSHVRLVYHAGSICTRSYLPKRNSKPDPITFHRVYSGHQPRPFSSSTTVPEGLVPHMNG